MPRKLFALPGGAAEPTIHLPLHDLPIQVTPFVGREQEVADACRLLALPDTRLLILVGAAGIGKTRLALQIGSASVGDFADGVYFVPLASISDPDLVLPTVAQTLDVREIAGEPVSSTLQGFLRDKQLLLLLDNFEQVIDAASDVANLLAGCAGLKVVATSREVLHIYGERHFPVPPLSLPDLGELLDPETLATYEAVALFVQRAQAVKPDFKLTAENAAPITEICIRLDGLPLAIELAAARVRLMSPQALLARLSNRLNLLTGGARNLPERQQTLRAAIDWGYDLLTPAEQKLFRQLSVFVGGFSLEAAEAVCPAAGESENSVLETVAALLDKSMIWQSEGEVESRFSMLETIREYGTERLEESCDATAVRQRHAGYFLTLVEAAEQGFAGPEQVAWVARLDANFDNVRAVLDWSLRSDDADRIGLRLAGALGWYWRVKGYLSEGRERLSNLLAPGDRTPQQQVNAPVAKALHALGWLCFLQGDYEEARRYYQESLAGYRRLGDMAGVTTVLMRLGALVTYQGDYPEALAFLQEGLTYARALGDKQALSTLLNVRGELARLEGDYAAARASYEESLALKRDLGGEMGVAVALHNLARVAQHQGQPEEAGQLFSEALRVFKHLGSTLDVTMCVAGLGGVAARQGNSERAAVLLGVASSQLDAIGARVWPADHADYEHDVETTLAVLGDAVWTELNDRGRAMLPDALVEYALMQGPPLPQAADSDAQEPPGDKSELTAREIEVVRLLALGLSNAEIASHLVLSKRTVHAHLQSIYSKLGVNTRTAAVHAATERGLGL